MSNKPINILHLLLAMGETSAPYNEHCLYSVEYQNIAICTFFTPAVMPAEDIILFAGNNTLSGFFHALWTALHTQNYDIIHAHSVHVAILLLFAKYVLRWKFTSHILYTLHSSYPNYKLTNKLMLLITIIFFQKIVCCSYASLDSLPVLFKHFAGDRLCVVQNGINIMRVDRVIKMHSKSHHKDFFTITSVGRLIEVKNPFAIQRAFKQSNNGLSRLFFIGEGHLYETLLKEVLEEGLEERIKFTGLIPREMVYRYLIETDLFISTSLIEGLPVAVLEAMACGCPVLLSDIASHREIAAKVDFIPLVPVYNISAYSQEIERFQKMSAIERTGIGEKCRKLVEDQFSLTKMHREYNLIYTHLIDSL
jgi:glycosyltransferase involved in cell wall biosynthesis